MSGASTKAYQKHPEWCDILVKLIPTKIAGCVNLLPTVAGNIDLKVVMEREKYKVKIIKLYLLS